MTMTLKCLAQVLQFSLISHKAGTPLKLEAICEESIAEFLEIVKQFDILFYVADTTSQAGSTAASIQPKEKDGLDMITIGENGTEDDGNNTAIVQDDVKGKADFVTNSGKGPKKFNLLFLFRTRFKRRLTRCPAHAGIVRLYILLSCVSFTQAFVPLAS